MISPPFPPLPANDRAFAELAVEDALPRPQAVRRCLRNDRRGVVARLDAAGADAGEPFIAVDTVGAGDGELVLVAQGSAAREAIRVAGPIDAAIVGILDSLTVGGKRTYSR
jgi:ethanolamine utilization protein EutN